MNTHRLFLQLGVVVLIFAVMAPRAARATLYYVNDEFTLGDVYTTAIGNDTNSGLTPSAPMYSLQTVLNENDIGPGDTIFIDTGFYSKRGDTVIMADDGGDASDSVNIIGSTNIAAGGTIMVRTEVIFGIRTTTFGDAVLRISSATNVVIQHIRARGAADGFVLDGSSTGCSILQCSAESNMFAGVRVDGANASGLLQNSVVQGQSVTGIHVEEGSLDVLNCTIFNVATDGIRMDEGELHVSNSIVLIRSPGQRCIEIIHGTYTGNYNNLAHDEDVAVGYLAASGVAETLADWQAATGQDSATLSHDPRLVDEAAGDAHLRSQAGWFNPALGMFIFGAEYSPSIDAGNPSSPYAVEPVPNGSRINQGAYGNTVEASKSRTNAALLAISYNDGGTVHGSIPLRWSATGLAPNAFVRLEYSADGGRTWQGMVSNLFVDAGNYGVLWDTFSIHDSQQCRWRVISEDDPYVISMSSSLFTVANGPEIVDSINPAGFSLRWYGESGRQYRVKCPTGGLEGTWAYCPGLTYTNGSPFSVAPGSNEYIVVIDTNFSASVKSFYAIEASDP